MKAISTFNGHKFNGRFYNYGNDIAIFINNVKTVVTPVDIIKNIFELNLDSSFIGSNEEFVLNYLIDIASSMNFINANAIINFAHGIVRLINEQYFNDKKIDANTYIQDGYLYINSINDESFEYKGSNYKPFYGVPLMGQSRKSIHMMNLDTNDIDFKL